MKNNLVTEKYLTEVRLGEFLKEYIPEGNWISQYRIPETRFKIDWFSEYLKLCVEFDGYQHYTSSKQILNDLKKDSICCSNGMKMIRIPYFVQLSKETIKYLFDKDIEYTQTYPHGFISNASSMLYPADFCYMGIERFKNDLDKFSCIKNSIIDSLKNKDCDIRLLLPESLNYLLS